MNSHPLTPLYTDSTVQCSEQRTYWRWQHETSYSGVQQNETVWFVTNCCTSTILYNINVFVLHTGEKWVESPGFLSEDVLTPEFWLVKLSPTCITLDSFRCYTYVWEMQPFVLLRYSIYCCSYATNVGESVKSHARGFVLAANVLTLFPPLLDGGYYIDINRRFRSVQGFL